LAVQGKLVKQDPSAESADQLLARVHAAKRELLSMGRIGKQKPTEPINEDETAFPLPQGWAWCRVGDLAWPQAGFAFKSTGFNEVGQGLPLIRIRDVGSTEEPTTFFSGEFRPEFVVEKGDWLISMDGEFRVRQWHAATALLNQRVTRLVFIVDDLHADFIATALQRELTALQGKKAYTTVDHLSGKQIAEAVIALPPATEQARIVARVDELMQLCDALEAKGRLEAQQHARLLETLLGTLTDSTTPEELAANWQRVAEHFDLLLDRPEAVDGLEQTVLQLAVRGLLVPQDSNDESVDEVITRIREHKDRLVAEGKIRSAKPLDEIAKDERPFSLPPTWAWVRFGDVTINRDGERIPVSSNDRERRGKVYDYYGASGVIDKIDGFLFDKTLLLIGEDGANLINRSTPIAFLAHGKYWVNNHAHVIDAMDLGLMRYLELFVNAISLEPYVTGTAQPKMNQAKLNSIVVALPPLAEQARIVARVTELRHRCADLRQRLAASQATQSRLAEALVESALA
jgi:type I restriction enzyme S subunit